MYMYKLNANIFRVILSDFVSLWVKRCFWGLIISGFFFFETTILYFVFCIFQLYFERTFCAKMIETTNLMSFFDLQNINFVLLFYPIGNSNFKRTKLIFLGQKRTFSTLNLLFQLFFTENLVN